MVYWAQATTYRALALLLSKLGQGSLGSGFRPSDAFVVETEPGDVLGLVDVTEIEKVLAVHRAGQPVEIQVAELVPFRQNDDGIGVLGGVVFVGAIDDPFDIGEGQLFRVLRGLRVENLHAAPSLDDLEDDGNG